VTEPLAFFGPVVESIPMDPKESSFLTEHPYSIISSGRQHAIPWITGINAQEGLITTGGICLINRSMH
jgi:carboxylesterase type B